MPQEIIEWCDPCYAQDIKTQGTAQNIGVQVGAARPTIRTLLLCPNHVDELLKPLTQLLDEYGTPVEVPTPGAKRPKDSGVRVSAAPPSAQTLTHYQLSGIRKGREPAGGRPNQCLWCPLSYTAASTGGFGRHVRVAHGFDGLGEAFGGPCPVCGEGPYLQILNHCNRAHKDMGFIAVAQPYLWARDNGDPHGVYAAKLEQKGSLDPAEEFQRMRELETRKTAHAAR